MRYEIMVITLAVGLSYSSAWADCTASVGSVSKRPNGPSVHYQGSDNADIITCANETKRASVDLGAGADTLIINDSPKVSVQAGNIPAFFGIDGDSYFFENNKVADNDRITLDRGSSAGNVYGDRYFRGTSNKGGRDTITIKAGSSVEFIAGDSFWDNASEGVGGNDTIIFDGGISLFKDNPFGAPVVGDEFLEGTGHTAGNDTIRILNQSTINGDILADMYRTSKPPNGLAVVAGNDTIIIDNSRVTKSIYGEAAGQGFLEPDKITDVAYIYRNRAGQITGNDRVELIGEKTEIGGNIKLYKGSDTVDYRGGKVIGEVDGGDDSSSADGYIDRFNVIGITQTASNIGIKESQLHNFEEYALRSSQIDYENSHTTGTYEKYTIDENSTATMTGNGNGAFTINSTNTINKGVIDLSDNKTGDALSVSENYTGNGQLRVDVNTVAQKADMLLVGGNTTGASTQIIPTFTAQAVNQPYEVPIINVKGMTAAGEFTFANGASTLNENGVRYDLILDGKVWKIRAVIPLAKLAKSAELSVDNNSNGKIDVGDTLTYTITATNTGNIVLTNVRLSDDRLSATKLCNRILPKKTCALAIDYVVTQDDMNAGNIVNSAKSSFNEITDITAKATTSLTQTPSLRIAKNATLKTDVNGNKMIDIGDKLSYTVKATNTGNIVLTNVIINDDKLNANKTCAILSPLQTCILTVDYVVTEEDYRAGEVVNQAQAKANEIARPETAYNKTIINKPQPTPTSVPAANWYTLLLLIFSMLIVSVRYRL